MRIEYIALDVILRAPRNPKLHDHAAITSSFERFGFVQPIVRDDATGCLVAGHGRLETLQMLYAAGAAVPEHIEVRDGVWFVPVICGVSFKSATEAEAYLLADNKITELGGYDQPTLERMLRDASYSNGGLVGTGYTQDDIAVMASAAREAAIAAQKTETVSTAPPVLRKTVCVWISGPMPPADVLARLQEAARAIPGARVEVGSSAV